MRGAHALQPDAGLWVYLLVLKGEFEGFLYRGYISYLGFVVACRVSDLKEG